MTSRYSHTDANPRRRGQHADSYDGIEDLFQRLTALEPRSPDRSRLREDIVRRCLPLADHIARRFTGRGERHDDLYQIASLGLVLAIDRFDADKGSSFLAFAIPTIMGEIRRHFRDHTWAVRVPRRIKELQQSIGPTINRLYQDLGRAPTALDIATELGVDLNEVTQALIADNGYRTDSIDTLSENSDDQRATDHLARLGRVEPAYDLTDEALAIAPLLARLPAFEARVLHLRFFDDRTQSQIADELDVSQMHISRVLSRTLDQLRRQAERE
ncbi:SigB/SigF/SigG family RNA polymerase sigma factor [Nocardia noduli]|uniref:SigB/SigF/SigG family RNA polymerase sigma factor n=1 Tax=Nocardia noduli TaxID=2815722 RepID=UPI001C212073|nr:SigB/SigF/SigG family RNA polymerase sigma factor [Nocardia noduli]